MQDDRIHWNGQPVALVLAETQQQADYAQSLIRVAYEEQNPISRSPQPRLREPSLACSWASR
jgi:CO/xanthine dehydrogenase Mo-binding subunit